MLRKNATCLIRRCPFGAGALIWHGKDLRHYRRLLSPPLQRLLSCPGTAALGRGVASMPVAAARRMGTGQVFSECDPRSIASNLQTTFRCCQTQSLVTNESEHRLSQSR